MTAVYVGSTAEPGPLFGFATKTRTVGAATIACVHVLACAVGSMYIGMAIAWAPSPPASDGPAPVGVVLELVLTLVEAPVEPRELVEAPVEPPDLLVELIVPPVPLLALVEPPLEPPVPLVEPLETHVELPELVALPLELDGPRFELLEAPPEPPELLPPHPQARMAPSEAMHSVVCR